MNLNDYAKVITLIEGKQESISIAQVKEILKILGDRWRNNTEMFLNEVQLIVKGAK